MPDLTVNNQVKRTPAGALFQVTFHLADALPVAARDLAAEYAAARAAGREETYLEERYLDQGSGACLLKGEAARIVEDCLLAQDSQLYRLLAWVVMPNHAHVLVHVVQPRALAEAVQGWKGASAQAINQLLGRSGPLWHKGYHDRLIRNEDHLAKVTRYIHTNPVKAGLAGEAGAWQFGSARRVVTLDATFHPPWDSW